MKVLINGAGVGGMATAIGLLANGHEVEIFERADGLRAGGNGVLLWPNATGILRELGADLGAHGRTLHTIETMRQDGELLARSDISPLARRFGSRSMVIRRGHIVRALAERLPAGTVRFGRSLLDCERRVSGRREVVSAVFADGSRAEGDVLIGADGYRSTVRRVLHDDGPAAYAGMTTWHGVTRSRLDVVSTGCLQLFMGRLSACVLHPIGDDLLHWAFEAPWPENGSFDGRSHLVRLGEMFAGWAESVETLLGEITDADVGTFPQIMHRSPAWGRGPISLAGDAAHTLPVRAGMGVNQALEDAWVLADVLTRPGPPASRLREYERTRSPMIRRARARAEALMKDSNTTLRLLRLMGGWFPAVRVHARAVRSSSNYLQASR